MNRYRSAIIMILPGLIVASQLRGQGVRLEPGISLGVTFPTGTFHVDPFGNGFRRGWLGTALVDLQGRYSRLGFRLEGSYGQSGSNGPATMKLTGGTVDVTYNLALPASVIAEYMVGGIGVYDVKLCFNGSSIGCRSVVTGGWNFGGRVLHRVGQSAAGFVELRYFNVGGGDLYGESVRPRFLSLTAGIEFLRPIGHY